MFGPRTTADSTSEGRMKDSVSGYREKKKAKKKVLKKLIRYGN